MSLLPQGAADARGRLIEHYLYLVGNTRLRVVPVVPIRVSEADLEGAGTVGLIQAIDRFDPTLRVRFESYAISTVRGAMLEYLRQDDWAPRSVRAKQRQLRKAAARLEARGQDGENITALAAELGVEEEDVYAMVAEAAVLSIVSLEDTRRSADPVGGDEDLIIGDSCCVTTADPSLDAMDLAQREALVGAIGRLPRKWRIVMVGYYLRGDSRRQVANENGIPERKVGEILTDGALELRRILAAQHSLFFEQEAVLTA